MNILPNTDIWYFYNLKSRIRYPIPIPISNMPYFETTFEVKKQKFKLKDGNNLLAFSTCKVIILASKILGNFQIGNDIRVLLVSTLEE